MSTQKRKAFTLKDKHDIIRKIENGVKQSDVCKQLNLTKSTVSTIWKKRQEILSIYDKRNFSCKKVRKSTHDQVDKGLLKWFSQKRHEHVPITGYTLQEKASELGRKIENTEFNCSRSWIERFKKRHNISGGKIVGETAGVDMTVVDQWLANVWPEIRESYEYVDIFNADETGLFYKMTPDKTLKFVGENCAGGKLSKVRITVLVTANMSGTEKRKLLVIGKSANPRCFKNKHLPVKYKSNSKAWMTSEIFKNELIEWDKELKFTNRKILLLIDNCPAHPEVDLQQIKLVFMPPNTSAKLQPMDQGVIHSLKCHYRKILLMKMLETIDKGNIFSVTLLDAINFIHMAWQRVSRETIANCFKHGGFLRKECRYDSDDELPLTQWIEKHREDPTDCLEFVYDADIQQSTVEIEIKKMFNHFNFEEYVCADNELMTREILTDDQIVTSVTSGKILSDNDDEDELGEGDNIYVPSISEMTKKMTETRNFLESREVPEHIWSSFCDLDNYINTISFSSKIVQTKITDFIV